MVSQVMQLLNETDMDLVWFKDNIEDIKEHYSDKFVAIKNGKILAAEKDMDNLMKTISKNKIRTEEILVQFVSSIPTIF
jgi:ABC-type enterochelin transport system ATPase subunit